MSGFTRRDDPPSIHRRAARSPKLLSILGGNTVTIDSLARSLLLQELMTDQGHKYILKALETRFGPVPPELEAEVKWIFDQSVLEAAHVLAVASPDLEHFATELRAIAPTPEPWNPANQPDQNGENRVDDGQSV
jgi:hypothetical protein